MFPFWASCYCGVWTSLGWSLPTINNINIHFKANLKIQFKKFPFKLLLTKILPTSEFQKILIGKIPTVSFFEKPKFFYNLFSYFNVFFRIINVSTSLPQFFLKRQHHNWREKRKYNFLISTKDKAIFSK